MPSVNASRKGQEKPREIVDAAEVGFLLPRVGARAEGGSGAIGRSLPWEPPTTLYLQAAAWSVAPQPSAPRGPTGPRLGARPEQPGTVFLENRGLGEA